MEMEKVGKEEKSSESFDKHLVEVNVELFLN